jgi:endo-1,3(4)-beta-glucanase
VKSRVVLRAIGVSLALGVLANCGGGGGGGGGAPVIVDPPPSTDTTAPTLTLSGAATLQVEQGAVFTDPGATATDNVDQTVNVVVTGSVDTAVSGSYTLTYTATDSSGNSASLERQVTVADTTAPVITLVGSTSIELASDTTYIEQGANALDSVDGQISVSISGTVGSAPGVYTLSYTATDAAGNAAETQRQVTVLAPPVDSGDDLLVLTSGTVDSIWTRGINAFDEANNYADCSNDGGAGCPSIAWQWTTDAVRGQVLEVTHGSSGLLAGLFFASQEGVDLSAFSQGAIEFDIKVVSGDAKITMKLDCFYPCTSGEQAIGERGVGDWERVVIPLSQLIAGGLDVTSVNTGLVIWATDHTDTVFQLDDIRFTGYDPNAGPPSPPPVAYNVTAMGKGSYSDTINPESYRCVFDYGNWIYNAGVVEPGIGYCNTQTGRPEGTATPKNPQLAGPALEMHTMTHRWWGSLSFIGEMRIDDPAGAGYLTPDPLTARISERGVRVLSIPAGLGANDGGFGYAIPTPFSEVFDGVAIANSQHANMEAKLLDYSDGTVTAGWYDGQTLVMEATFVHGSPYLFFSVYSGTPILKTLRSNGGERGIWHEGGSSLGVWTSVAGQHNDFLLVGDAGTSYSNVDTDTVSIQTPTGAFTLAWVPSSTTQSREALRPTLELYARQPVQHVSIDYQVDRTTNNVNVRHRYLDAAGNPVQTLAGLQPMAWKRSSTSEFVASTRSARGLIKFAAVSTFDYELPSIGVLPTLPTLSGALDEAQLASLVDEFVAGGPNSWNTANDTYWNGKAVGRVAEVLAIADQLDMSAAANTLRDWLKGELADWMTAERNGTLDTENYFVYDSQWDTLLGMEESFASHQQLNDHHFHYGYFIRAAAEVCREDSAFCSAEQYGPMFELLIRDYAGGRDDPLFPYLRNFDPAFGFSWASGNVNFVRGNNNESTSEAANAYGAMILYGLVTGNDAITERGMYLHASTAAAYWEYWNDIDGYRALSSETRNFPSGYPRITTSIIWGDGSAFATWFSGAYAHILGIQALPSNPLMMHVGLYDDYLADYVTLGLTESSNGKPSGLPQDQWTDLWWNMLALTDPDAAIADYEATVSYSPEAGEAPAHTFHWIYTMRALGSLQTGTGDLTADYPAAMAFQTAQGLTSYVVYNFGNSPRTVTFSNGVTVEAQANAFAVVQQ